MDPVAPLCQVSPNSPLPLYLISPLSYILPTCYQILILNLPTSLYFNTPTTFLFTPPLPSMTFQPILPPAPPPPHFCFLLYLCLFPCYQHPHSPLSIACHCFIMLFTTYPSCTPHPHFHFFGLFMVIPLPSTHFPYSFTLYTTVLPYSNSLDNTPHPLPPPGPPPPPTPHTSPHLHFFFNST